LKCEIAQQTRTGRRPHNEDRVGCWQTDEALLLALADGMGGHSHGSVAAQVVLDCLAKEFWHAAGPRLADPDLFLFRSMTKLHAGLCAYARDQGLPETPRTTLVACVVQDGIAYWIHVGDSRLYHVREGKVIGRTRDQTLVQALIESGEISEAEAASHPRRNVVLQCLGGPLPPRTEPSTVTRLRRGDVVLLCSDGFYGTLAPRDICGALAATSLQQALAELASAAEERAGRYCDNLSALGLAWHDEERPDRQAARDYPMLTEEAAEPADNLEYLRMSDEEVERQVARLKEAFRMNGTEAVAGELPCPTDEEIEYEIARLRQAFRP
jgi:serine/threonine protein phosphatase PrpC